MEPRLLDAAAAKPAAPLAAAAGGPAGPALVSSGLGGAASGGSKLGKGQPRKPLGKLDKNSGKGSVLRAR